LPPPVSLGDAKHVREAIFEDFGFFSFGNPIGLLYFVKRRSCLSVDVLDFLLVSESKNGHLGWGMIFVLGDG
jgi:hypothetical protein